MSVQVFYFALLREERGCSQEERTIEPGTSVSELFSMIFGRKPIGIRFAMNQSYVSAAAIPSEGDEIAFLPPLVGG